MRSDILPGLIWVQTVCKGYQQTTKHEVKLRLEDLKVLKRSPDLLNNVKIGQGQLWLIIQSYFVLPYMGSGHFDQVT